MNYNNNLNAAHGITQCRPGTNSDQNIPAHVTQHGRMIEDLCSLAPRRSFGMCVIGVVTNSSRHDLLGLHTAAHTHITSPDLDLDGRHQLVPMPTYGV